MHRCQGPDGRFVFSDTPCAAESRDLTEADRIVVDAPPPIISLKVDYYDLHGASWNAVIDEIRAKGLRGGWDNRPAAGLTGYRYTYTHEFVEKPGRCQLARIQVSLATTITTPRWIAPSGVAPPVRAKIEAEMRRIEGHERLHHSVAVQAAYDLRERLAAVEPRRHCVQVLNDLRDRYVKFIPHERNMQADFHRRETQEKERDAKRL